MARTKKLGFIPVQPADQTAAFAGLQYNLLDAEACGNDAYNSRLRGTKMHSKFRDSILRLLYSNFAWYGLEPDEANMIENFLILEGRVCAIKESFSVEDQTADGVYFGRFGTDVPDMRWDFYGNPLKASCSGFSGYIAKADSPDNFVLGFDTMAVQRSQNMTMPLFTYIDDLAVELDKAYSAWKVATETRKIGMVFQCSTPASEKLLKSVLKDLSDGSPFVVVQGDLQGGTEQVQFAPGTGGAIEEFHMNFMNAWGMVLDILGLENNSQNKRERLVVSEAELNRSLSRYLAADRLRARQIFAEQITKKFGRQVTVENYLASIVDETPEDANKPGRQGEEASDTPEGGMGNG